MRLGFTLRITKVTTRDTRHGQIKDTQDINSIDSTRCYPMYSTYEHVRWYLEEAENLINTPPRPSSHSYMHASMRSSLPSCSQSKNKQRY